MTGTSPGATSMHTTSPSEATTTNASTTDGSATTSSEFLPPPPIKFDLGVLPDAAQLDDGCRAVDFLFVIDNSGSMSTYQENLVNNFPAFINGIKSTLTEVDSYHVGVTTTDAYGSNPPGCDELGGLVTATGSGNTYMACGPYAEGHNFMTEADDLEQTFSCAANVGTSGSGSERPMAALEAAIGGGLTCNEGFIREDALLVVIIITDEADSSPGTPESWYESVVAAKNGIPENSVVVSLVRHSGDNCSGGISSSDAPEIVAFTELFSDNGFVEGICEDYSEVFSQAVGIIENACNNFVAPN